MNSRRIFVVFIYIFGILPKFRQFCLKIVKTVNHSTVDFVLRDTKSIVDYFDLIFLANICAKYFKIRI